METAIVKRRDRIFHPTDVPYEDKYLLHLFRVKKVNFYNVLSVHYDQLKHRYTNKCTTVQSMYSFYCFATTCFGVITFCRELTPKYH
jgi:hypothetical protein